MDLPVLYNVPNPGLFSVSGIVGPTRSHTTKPVAEVTGKFPASVISPLGSSPELSDTTRFPYFMRTGQLAAEQVKVGTKSAGLWH